MGTGNKSVSFKEIILEETQPNATQPVGMTNVGPAGIGTSTIARWMKVKLPGSGTIYYIPMWT